MVARKKDNSFAATGVPPDDVVLLYMRLVDRLNTYESLYAARKNPEFYKDEWLLWNAMGIEQGKPVGASFWQSSVLMATEPNPPKWMTDLSKQGWQKAWAARCQLEAAMHNVIQR